MLKKKRVPKDIKFCAVFAFYCKYGQQSRNLLGDELASTNQSV